MRPHPRRVACFPRSPWQPHRWPRGPAGRGTAEQGHLGKPAQPGGLPVALGRRTLATWTGLEAPKRALPREGGVWVTPSWSEDTGRGRGEPSTPPPTPGLPLQPGARGGALPGGWSRQAVRGQGGPSVGSLSTGRGVAAENGQRPGQGGGGSETQEWERGGAVAGQEEPQAVSGAEAPGQVGHTTGAVRTQVGSLRGSRSRLHCSLLSLCPQGFPPARNILKK